MFRNPVYKSEGLGKKKINSGFHIKDLQTEPSFKVKAVTAESNCAFCFCFCFFFPNIFSSQGAYYHYEKKHSVITEV